MNSSKPIYVGDLTQQALQDSNNTHTILLNWIVDNSRVLEIGCATGYMTRVLTAQKSCIVDGFEINEEAAEQARPFLNRLWVGNLEDKADLGQIDGLYDVVLVADVFEHLCHPELVLSQLRQHLLPGGDVLISLPNVAHWSVRRALLFGRWDLTDRGLMDRTHLRWFTRSTAEAMIRQAGFSVERRRASYAFPAHWRAQLGPCVAAFAQKRNMPPWFDDLFAVQHLFQARPVESPKQAQKIQTQR